VGKPEAADANQRTLELLGGFLLTSEGFTGYISLRVVRGKIEVVRSEATVAVDDRGRWRTAMPPFTEDILI
jgi:hypothetical protein